MQFIPDRNINPHLDMPPAGKSVLVDKPVDKGARADALRAMDRPIRGRLPKDSCGPLPGIGVRRELLQGGAHEAPSAAKTPAPRTRDAAAGEGVESNRGGTPRNVDGEASDADAIGILPVHAGLDDSGRLAKAE